jgi:hypothetical protein
VPVLTLTAQAFSSIALSHDATKTARAIACLLSLVMTGLSLHLMIKHRQAEVADSQWLETYENQLPPQSPGGLNWPRHGPNWSSYRPRIDPNVGQPGFLWRANEFRCLVLGLGLIWCRRDRVLFLTMLWPSLLGSS